MGLVATEYGIKEALRQLGVEEVNNGSSTGSEFFANGGSIASFSPVDGKLIAKVNTTSPEDFERVMSTATDAFNIGEQSRHHREERSSGSSEIN